MTQPLESGVCRLGIVTSAEERTSDKREGRHQDLHQDLHDAESMQRRFLPAIDRIPGWRAAAEYRPAFGVGGDFYDLIPTANGGVVVAMGDVSGHGVSAALLMARASCEVRRLARAGYGPAALLRNANRSLLEQAPAHAFVTLACVRLDPQLGRGTAAGAGHVPPILQRRRGTEALALPPGEPLGILARPSYAELHFAIEPDDILVLVTDGALDALDPNDAQSSLGLLLALVRDAPHDVDELRRSVITAVETSVRGAAREQARDDLSLLAVTRDRRPPLGLV